MDLNDVSLTGNITNDIESRDVNDSTVASFNIAVDRSKDTTDFFPVEVWGRTAELVQEYCSKGSKVAVSGSIQQDRWQDDNGNNRSRLKVKGNQIVFLSSNASPNQSQSNQSSSNQSQSNQSNNSSSNQPDEVEDVLDEVDDEDIPF